MSAAPTDGIELMIYLRNTADANLAKRRAAAEEVLRKTQILQAAMRLPGPELLAWFRQGGSSLVLDHTNERRDTTGMHPHSSTGIQPSLSQYPVSALYDHHLRGIDLRKYAWIPTDYSIFPRMEPDKVYINGRVYSQAYGRLQFQLPPESYCPTQASDGISVSSQQEQRETSDPVEVESDDHVEMYDDETTSDDDWVYALHERVHGWLRCTSYRDHESSV
ncbi:hypothetical protein FRC12_001537 [Ceratobasidium sp. 428]|nr:hypothetical protein FRC12_001537 [Ceratobasidium sp. 428]